MGQSRNNNSVNTNPPADRIITIQQTNVLNKSEQRRSAGTKWRQPAIWWAVSFLLRKNKTGKVKASAEKSYFLKLMLAFYRACEQNMVPETGLDEEQQRRRAVTKWRHEL
jgi:hypothetical protein